MKILIACFLLSTMGLAYATPASIPLPLNYKELIENLEEDLSAAEVESDDDIADLQGVFNILEQIETEKAKAMDEDSAIAQLWGSLGKILWKTGERYLRNRYCTKEEEMRAMIEELVDEQETSKNNQAVEQGIGDSLNELRNLMKYLRVHMVTDGDVATAEGWFKKVRKSIKKRAKKVARKVLC